MTDDRSTDTPSDAEPLPFDLAELLESTPGLLRQLRGEFPNDGRELDEELAALQEEVDSGEFDEEFHELVEELDRDGDLEGLFDSSVEGLFDGTVGAFFESNAEDPLDGDDDADGSDSAETDGGVGVDDEPITVDGETVEEEYTPVDETTGEVIDDESGDDETTSTEAGASESASPESGSAGGASVAGSNDDQFPSRDDFGAPSRDETPSGDDTGPDASWWKSRGRSLRGLLARIFGAPGVTAATIVGFEGLTYAVGKFIPAYLFALHASPVIVGLYGTLMIATAAATAAVSSHLPDSGLVERGIALIAAAGLALWALAPDLPTIAPVPAWGPVLAGGVLVGTLGAIADTPVDLIEGPHARRPTPTRRSLRRTGGILAGLAIVAVLMSAASSIQVALQVGLVLAAALGVTVAAFPEPEEPAERTIDLPGVLDRDAEKPVTPEQTTVTIENTEAQIVDSEGFGSGLSSLSPSARALLLGELLVDAALALIMVFVVVVATRVLAVSIAGFGPYVVFTALVAIERVAGLVASRVGPSLADATGPGTPAIIGGLLAAVFPLLLISAPANAVVVGLAFALFGLRFVATDARERLRRSVTGHVGQRSTRLLRTGVLVVSPLIGGVLYHLNAVLAFGAATAIGVLGVRELVRAAHEIEYLEPINT